MRKSERTEPSSTNTYHHGALRVELLAAARKVLETHGPEAVSLKALATELGVSQSAPYRHFRSRDALLAAIAIQGFEQFRARMSEVSAGDSPRVSLERSCQAYLQFSRDNPGLYRLMFASHLLGSPSPESGSDDPLQQQAKRAFEELLQRLSDTATSGAEPKSRENVKNIAALIWTSLHGMAMLEIVGLPLGPPSERIDSTNVIRTMASLLAAS